MGRAPLSAIQKQDTIQGHTTYTFSIVTILNCVKSKSEKCGGIVKTTGIDESKFQKINCYTGHNVSGERAKKQGNMFIITT